MPAPVVVAQARADPQEVARGGRNVRPHPPPARRPPGLGEEIDRVCDRFDAAWDAGARPQIEDYLQAVPESARSELLRELLAADVEHRSCAGDRPAPDEYLARFPDRAATIVSEFGSTRES